MVLSEIAKMTEAEYLAMELEEEEMHEYFDGKVVVKERGYSIDHCRIFTTLVAEVGNFLKGKSCNAYLLRLRAGMPDGSAYVYPDVFVVCGKTEIKKDCFDTVINPSVMIEITTSRTRDHDMGLKFWYYTQMPTVKEYIIVDSMRHHIITCRRQSEDTWQFITTEGVNSSITMNTIEMELPLSDIYFRVSFDDGSNL